MSERRSEMMTDSYSSHLGRAKSGLVGHFSNLLITFSRHFHAAETQIGETYLVVSITATLLLLSAVLLLAVNLSHLPKTRSNSRPLRPRTSMPLSVHAILTSSSSIRARLGARDKRTSSACRYTILGFPLSCQSKEGVKPRRSHSVLVRWRLLNICALACRGVTSLVATPSG